MENEKKIIKFEEAIERIEQIVNVLQDNSISIDESFNIFQEGIGLIRFCQNKLEDIEGKVNILIKDENGNYIEKPFNVEM